MKNMKKHRKLAGFTQEKLAELCDTDPCYIRQIESGRRCPSMTYIEKIATALDIAPYLLFYDTSDPALGRGKLLATQKDAFTHALIDGICERIHTFTDEYL
ncbi:MAG: helix-turn-helix transcriptional regulator [Treponema sp.]|nr:helix-turn-helix transcriptional regulator [Treponema sp.]